MPNQVTHNVRVSVQSHLSPEHSNPGRHLWFFIYDVVIRNEGERTVQLLTRHWRITDANGVVEEVRGPGVVGERPVLTPGESFRYSSGCPLKTPFGSMQGTYQMTNERGELFDVVIPAFALRDPRNMQ